MDCIVAASTGALKGINLRENSFTNLLPIKTLTPKQDEITSMIWSKKGQSEVLAALLDRQLKLYDTEANKFTRLFRLAGGDGPVCGLHTTEGDKIVSCVESGHVNVWDGSDPGQSVGDWQAGGGVKVMKGLCSRNEVVTGGVKHLVKTWDIETGKRVWSARNVPLDFLGLEVPVACTDAAYVDDSGNIVEATKVHELRLYDPRAQRRPVKKMPFMDVPITAVSKCYRDKHVLAANSIGEMGLFDLRSKLHPVCKYKGQAGAIRCIDAHPTAPYVATCGIDRFVHVHDIDTRKLIHKVYCKTRLNRVLIRSDGPGLTTDESVKDEQDWKELEEDASCDSSFASSSDNSDDECTWEKQASSDETYSINEGNTNSARKRRENDKPVKEMTNGDVEPAVKKKRMAKSKKRKEDLCTAEVCSEPRKKVRIERGVKRHDVAEQKVNSDEEPTKRRRVPQPVECVS